MPHRSRLFAVFIPCVALGLAACGGGGGGGGGASAPAAAAATAATASDERIYAIAVDADGNRYVAGTTSAVLVAAENGGGGTDAFVAKFDANGGRLWLHQFGSGSNDEARAIAVDAAGNAYVAGWTYGAIVGSQPNAGLDDAFVVAFDTSGNRLWVRQFGTSSSDTATAIAVNTTGVYVSGSTSGKFPGFSANSGRDAFVARINADGVAGVTEWIQQRESSGTEEATALALDGGSNLTIAGYQQSTGALVVQYNSGGTVLWEKTFGNAGDEARAIASDLDNNLIVAVKATGPFEGQTTQGSEDIGVIKLDGANGNTLWVAQIGTGARDEPTGIALDDAGGVYVSGWTFGAPSGGANAGAEDIFLMKLTDNATGAATTAPTFQWWHNHGTAATDVAYGMASDLGNDLYLVGASKGGLGAAGALAPGGVDGVMLRFDSSGTAK